MINKIRKSYPEALSSDKSQLAFTWSMKFLRAKKFIYYDGRRRYSFGNDHVDLSEFLVHK